MRPIATSSFRASRCRNHGLDNGAAVKLTKMRGVAVCVAFAGNGGAGGSGLFRTIAFTRQKGTKYYAAQGETIVCAIEFSASQRAQCLLGYGNATQPGSPHLEDQLPMMVRKKLLPVLRDKKDIERNLEKREMVKTEKYKLESRR